MKYKTEKEILKVIANFENCKIKRGSWGHPEHLILAYHYASNNDFETALNKMRDGIFRLLKSFEINLTKEMPYHETLTVFWMTTVFEFAKSSTVKPLPDMINELIKKFDKNYPLKFYRREILFSDKARRSYYQPSSTSQDVSGFPPE